MRPDIVPWAKFPDYELSDHTAKRRKLSELQGQHPMVLVVSRGGYCPKDRTQAELLVQLLLFFGRPTLEDLRQDLRAVTRKCRPDWTSQRRNSKRRGSKDARNSFILTAKHTPKLLVNKTNLYLTGELVLARADQARRILAACSR